MTDLQALSDAATPAEKWGGVQTWENILRSWIGPTGNRSAARADAALIVAAVNHVRETLRAATPVVPPEGLSDQFDGSPSWHPPVGPDDVTPCGCGWHAASPSPDTDREHTITIPVSKLDELVREVARRESPDTDREGEKAALTAGTHEPAVDDFGNQYLERLRPSPEHTITVPVSKLDELVREVARRESPDTGAGLDVRRMTVAIERELHLDEAHGFPPGFTARELALHLADHYDHAPVEEPVR